MRSDKTAALQLRSTGKSYNEIKATLGIPKSTLSDWLSRSAQSKQIKTALTQRARAGHILRLHTLSDIRGKHLARLYEEARAEARREFVYLKSYPLFTAGVALYWGEGNKASLHSLSLGNTDPAMIRLFVVFLRAVCGAPEGKIRAYILLYPDLDPKTCLRFWIKSSGLPKTAFNKCVRIKGRHKTRRLHYGVCVVSITSRYLKEKVQVWLNLLADESATASAGIVHR
jgi:hypothetical protein